MIVIICAMEREAEAIINAMTQKNVEWNDRPFPAIIGMLGGHRVLVITCNTGKVNAAAATVQAYFTVKPSVIINLGVCGALGFGIHRGDVVVPQEFLQYDIDTSDVGDPQFLMSGIGKVSVPAHMRGHLLANAISKRAGIEVNRTYYCATGDRFLGQDAMKSFVFGMTTAHVCDMEAGAIAQVCALYGIPFVAAKVVSDERNDSADDYKAFMAEAPERILSLALAGIDAYGQRGDS